jgi:hypothetical protein
MSRADLPPSILWRNRQNEARLVLRHKPRNRHGDFETQIIKPELPVLRPQPGNPPPPWFWVSTNKLTTNFEAKPGETVAISFEAKLEKTVATGFEAKLPETVAAGFEAKPLESVTTGFEVKPLTNRPSDFEVKPLTKDKRKTKWNYPGFEFKPRQVNDSSQSN